MHEKTASTGLTYASSGVDIDEGNRLVKLIKPLVRSTRRPGVLSDIGGFGALFSGRFKGVKDPVLVSSTDGVGTKLKVAFLADRHSTVGIDLVAMSVNDILVNGAEPLFFLDYFATGRLSADTAADVIKGIAAGCKDAGCALVGGETAEMPGFYSPGEYDLAGFAVGVVDRKKIIDGRRIRPGDAIIGLASTGLHSNGYSLTRKVIFDRLGLKVDDRPEGLGGKSVADALIAPTRIYVRPVLKLIKEVDVLGLVHITGGGFYDNIPRVLPPNVKAVIERGSWRVPDIFRFIREKGNVDEHEMLRTFNSGIGMAVIVRPGDEGAVLKAMKKAKVAAYSIGRIEKGRRKEVEFTGPGRVF